MPVKYKNLEGVSNNRLTIIREIDPKITSDNSKVRRIECKCICGNIVNVLLYSFFNGHVKSCGCLHKENTSKSKSTLNIPLEYSKTPLAALFRGMITRCFNKNVRSYADYGGRGITICQEWLNNPVLFFNWCKENGWKKGLQIDRKDNNGNYEPSNCRFLTPRQNANNKRNSVMVELNGIKMSLGEAYDILDPIVNYKTFRDRYLNHGFSLEDCAKAKKHGRNKGNLKNIEIDIYSIKPKKWLREAPIKDAFLTTVTGYKEASDYTGATTINLKTVISFGKGSCNSYIVEKHIK